MGFDVLAFESGLYDCRKAWEALQRGDKPLESFQQGVFGIWTGSEEVQPLIEYVGNEAKGRHPLELCGFDCQFTAAASKNHLGRDIEQVFNELPMQSFTAQSRGDVLQLLADILQAQQNPPTLAEMAAKSRTTQAEPRGGRCAASGDHCFRGGAGRGESERCAAGHRNRFLEAVCQEPGARG